MFYNGRSRTDTTRVPPDQLAVYADDICGRDIRNAVVDAAVRGARYEKERVELQDLIEAIDRIKAARVVVKSHEDRK